MRNRMQLKYWSSKKNERIQMKINQIRTSISSLMFRSQLLTMLSENHLLKLCPLYGHGVGVNTQLGLPIGESYRSGVRHYLILNLVPRRKRAWDHCSVAD